MTKLCELCETPLEGTDGPLCAPCDEDIEEQSRPACDICELPLENGATGGICDGCISGSEQRRELTADVDKRLGVPKL